MQIFREARSPLARLLFGLDGVKAVFLTDQFVTVTVEDADMWPDHNDEILGIIMDFYSSGRPIMDEKSTSKLSIVLVLIVLNFCINLKIHYPFLSRFWWHGQVLQNFEKCKKCKILFINDHIYERQSDEI